MYIVFSLLVSHKFSILTMSMLVEYTVELPDGRPRYGRRRACEPLKSTPIRPENVQGIIYDMDSDLNSRE